MNVTCPGCGAEMSLDVLFAHEDSRRALARLATISVPLGAQVMRYLALFRPAKRQMSHSRVVTLIEELLPDLERGRITRKGREWPAPLDSWRAAIETVLEARDKGSLTLPLKSHGYLYEVLLGMADKAEAAGERERETQRQGGRAYVAGAAPIGEVLAGVGVEPSPPSVATPAPSASTPAVRSASVAKMKAEIERRKAARSSASQAEEPLENVTESTGGDGRDA